jgi:DNA polymerase-4
MRQRAIIHLDMDAFYAAVEVLDNPQLKGKPVVVGGSKERGVVSSASYEARKFGIHSAQPIITATHLCPQGIFLPVRMPRYRAVSRQVFEIFRGFTPLIEPLSIDEAFLDVTDCVTLFGRPEEIAKKIRRTVVEEVGLTVSAGVAPSKFVAKIASDLQKPDGLTVVPAGEVQAFLDPLPIERLWGVGRETQKALSLIGVRTIGELRAIPLDILEAKFGKHGTHLHLLSQGKDDREVEPVREAKSIGREQTFAEDLLDIERIKRETLSLATWVSRRLRRDRLEGRTITLKVKYMDFVMVTRSTTLAEATDDGKEIFESCCRLLQKTEAGRRPVRLLGIAVSLLCKQRRARQLELFQDGLTSGKSRQLNLAVDKIRDKFGEDAILPGTLLEGEKRKS